jgi:hypothetical protein
VQSCTQCACPVSELCLVHSEVEATDDNSLIARLSARSVWSARRWTHGTAPRHSYFAVTPEHAESVSVVPLAPLQVWCSLCPAKNIVSIRTLT